MKIKPPGAHALSLSKAFTLVEVMVGVAIAAIGIASVCVGIAYGLSVTDATRKNLRGTQVMLETFEIVRLYNWDQVTATNPRFLPTNVFASYNVDLERQSLWWNLAASTNSPDYHGVVTIQNATNNSYSSDLKIITVKLQWEIGSVTNTRVMNTLVSRYGVQNYIY